MTILIFGGVSETLGFGLCDKFHFWGGILKLSNLDSVTILILGGYSETLGLGLSDNFHFWGGILKLSDLDSLTIFILGEGGILYQVQNRGKL